MFQQSFAVQLNNASQVLVGDQNLGAQHLARQWRSVVGFEPLGGGVSGWWELVLRAFHEIICALTLAIAERS